MTQPRARPRAVRPGEEAPPPDAAPLPLWLIEAPGEAPRIIAAQTAEHGTRVVPASALATGEHVYMIERVESRTIAQRFAVAIVAARADRAPVTVPDGLTAQRMIVKPGGISPRTGEPVPTTVVWEGTIEAVVTYRMHEIDHSRTLRTAEWSHLVRFRTTNRSGIVREADVAMMQLHAQQAQKTFLDALGLTTLAKVADVIAYMRIIVDRLPDNGIAIAGQGPVVLPDGTRAFVAASGVFDEHGCDRPEIIVDTSGIPRQFGYYDVIPTSQVDDALVRGGVADLIRAYGEIPAHPEITAAFHATVFTAPLATLDIRYFVAPFLYGIPGSGKSRLSRRMDAIQSRTVREYSGAKPVLNLGVTTGTGKGAVYRAELYGGFAITCDDVVKSGDSVFQMDNAKTHVSNLIRSRENGGGALGRVNKSRNRIESGQSGELHSNIRFTSEKPIPGLSTVDRMIMLPALTDTWDVGPFDREVSQSLWTRESLEQQAHAVSALTHWIFARLVTTDDYFTDARLITRQWSVSARTADYYAAVVAAHLIFRSFAAEHGADASTVVDTAITALRGCAERQTQSKLSPADLFRSRLRLAIADQRVSFAGRPLVNEDGQTVREYTSPFTYVTHEADEMGLVKRDECRPPEIGRLSQLGLIGKGGSGMVRTLTDVLPFGYVVAPTETKRNSRDTSAKWQLMLTREQIERLADTLTKYSRDKDGCMFTPDSIRDLVTSLNVGSKDKRRMCLNESGKERSQDSKKWVTVIDMEWLFAPLDDEGEE